ncbi:MAG: arginine--tRNA ligase [Patescibacteria group bacterium]
MPNYTWDAIVAYVARRIAEDTDSDVTAKDLVAPPKPELGDMAFGCFALAKKLGKNPAEIAKELAPKLGKNDHTIESATAAGPYVNIFLKSGDFINRIVQEVENQKAEFGASEDGNNKEILVEYAQPNTHKEIHVGHLRNLVLGASLAKILQKNGWKVTTASYHGDVGAHVSKCLWLFVRELASAVPQPKPKRAKKGQEPTPPLSAEVWTDHVIRNLDEEMAERILAAVAKKDRTGEHLGSLYAESTKLLEENPAWKDEVSFVQQQLEARAKGWMKIWQETRRWSVAEMDTIFQELGVSIDRHYFESEVVDDGQKIVDELLKKNIAVKSQGAIVVPMEDLKLGVFLIRKSDGTSLYATKDLALAKLKLREYPKTARSLIIVDNRQELYFKQLFETLKRMGIKVPFEFVGYEFLTLKSGAMSSREGNIVTYESFRDEVVNYATGETSGRHEEWNDGRIHHTAWALAMGGVKFGMLKQDSDKIITFDLEKALSFDGDTGPYVQYAATRLGAILKKAGWKAEKGVGAGDLTLLSDPHEKRLALQIAAFPAACRTAALELRPMVIAQWCLHMAHRVTEFYHEVNVLESEFGVKQARLQLVAAAQTVLILGLDLLGIPLPDEM